MVHKKALETLNRTLRDFRSQCRLKLFGGALLLLSGDSRQTLPVIPRSTPANQLNACLKLSVLWRHVIQRSLSTNMRVLLQNDPAGQRFAEQLLRIGNGEYPTEDSAQTITLPSDCCQLVSTQMESIEKVFPNLYQNYTSHAWLKEHAILASRKYRKLTGLIVSLLLFE